MKRTVLVTGASGFIGRHISRALESAGYGVHGIDPQHESGHFLDHVQAWDARDFFRKFGHSYDVVVHAAAVVGGRAKIDGDPLALAVNLELDAALFQWAARTHPGRVVYLSSSAVYPVFLQSAGDPMTAGMHCRKPEPDMLADPKVRERMKEAAKFSPASLCPTQGRPGHGTGCMCGTWLLRDENDRKLSEASVDLDNPQLPDALYGWCKLTGERLASLARAAGVPVSIVRPFSGYGEDQGEDYPFAAMAARARRRDDPFDIWGSGEQVRDWIHVDDICAAILAMVEQGIDGPVNLGTGRATSMRQLAGMFAAAAGYEPEFRPLPEMPSGVAYRVADVTRLSDFFTPSVSLEDGIERSIKEGA